VNRLDHGTCCRSVNLAEHWNRHRFCHFSCKEATVACSPAFTIVKDALVEVNVALAATSATFSTSTR
jgi:hypothetical protein